MTDPEFFLSISLFSRRYQTFFPDFIRPARRTRTARVCRSSCTHYTVRFAKQLPEDSVDLIAFNPLPRRHGFGNSSERETLLRVYGVYGEEGLSSSDTLLWSLALSRCDVTHETDGSAVVRTSLRSDAIRKLFLHFITIRLESWNNSDLGK